MVWSRREAGEALAGYSEACWEVQEEGWGFTREILRERMTRE